MYPSIPLEDNFTDILGKAQRGLAISDSQLAEQAGVTVAQVHALRGGEVIVRALQAIAPVLGLDPRALIEFAEGNWEPEPAAKIEGLAQFNTRYGDMTVNSYLAWDPASRQAVVFDSGADCSPMLEEIAQRQLTVASILLTHAHPDHVADLARLKQATGAPVFGSEREPTAGAETFSEGREFSAGALRIESRLTWGHSRGGTTFIIRGLARPVAVVGDALFAGSMGGGSVSYEAALQNNRDKILTLPEETIICPGHGPLTTVGEEKRHNPFFGATAKQRENG